MTEMLKQWWPYAAAAIGALWAAYKYFDSERRKRDDKVRPAKVTATRGSIAVGSISGGSINSPPASDHKSDGQ